MTTSVGGAPGAGGRAALAWLLKLGVSAVVLAVILHLVGVGEVWREARKLPPELWLAGLLIFLAGHAAAAAKWRLLIGPGISYPEAFRAHLAGLAANLCLPSVAGGDVVRAGLVYRQAGDPVRLAAGSLADRLLDTLGLVILATVGGLLAFGSARATGPELLLVGGVLALMLPVGALLIVTGSRRLAKKPRVGKLGRLAAAFTEAVAGLVREPQRLLLCLGMSVAIQAVFVGVNIAFASAAGVAAPVSAWFFAWASAKIIAIAPISLGGLGVREASLAGLLAPFGASAPRVIAVGLIWQTLLYASGLIGLLVQAAWRPRAPGRCESTPAMQVETAP